MLKEKEAMRILLVEDEPLTARMINNGLTTNGIEVDWCEDREQAIKACLDAVKGERKYDIEFRVVRPDGNIRWIKADGVVLFDDVGEPCRMVGTNYDITRYKEK